MNKYKVPTVVVVVNMEEVFAEGFQEACERAVQECMRKMFVGGDSTTNKQKKSNRKTPTRPKDTQESIDIVTEIRDGMQEEGLSTLDLAEKAGLAKETIGAILRGDTSKPQRRTLLKIAKVLGRTALEAYL